MISEPQALELRAAAAALLEAGVWPATQRERTIVSDRLELNDLYERGMRYISGERGAAVEYSQDRIIELQHRQRRMGASHNTPEERVETLRRAQLWAYLTALEQHEQREVEAMMDLLAEL